MRICLNTEALTAFNLSAKEVYQALATNNSIATMGYAENSRQRIDIVADSQLTSVSEFEQLVISNHDGATIHLRDIARIELAAEEASVTARLNDNDTVYISIWPLPGANEIDIGDSLYEKIAELNQTLPSGMSIDFAFDGTLYMRDALSEIFITLIETVVLVGLVVLLLMGSFRSAMVPLITIPISILGAVAAMSFMGFSLNLLTVLAIVLSVGLVVDDAIVVVENVAGKECLICFDCGDPSDACKLTCCHQMVHISCLKQWHKLSVNKDCPHCRAPLKTVVKIITKPTLSPFNLRKNLTKGLIYKYIK